jgi:hypothetical protein
MKESIQKNLTTFGVNVNNYKTIESIYVDPETVLTIVETGMKLKEMFGNKKGDRKDELKLLQNIQKDIRKIQIDIKLIINLLRDLKVYIIENQIDFISNVLTADISTANLELIEWLDNDSNTDTNILTQQFMLIHRDKILLGQYGYANIHVYILAFKTELDLAYWLKRGKESMLYLLDESRNYFDKALTVDTKEETPSKRLSIVDNAIFDLNSNYQPTTFTQDITVLINAPKGCWVDGYKKVRQAMNVTGSIYDGFTYTISDQIIEKQDPTRDTHCRVDGPVGPHIKSMGNLFPKLQTKPVPLDEKRKEYEMAREIYLDLLKSQMELTATVNTIKDMIRIIDNYFSE